MGGILDFKMLKPKISTEEEEWLGYFGLVLISVN